MDYMNIVMIVPDYLNAILSWPVSFFVISLIFILKFKVSIGNFLDNISSIKFGSFEATQKQTSVPDEALENNNLNAQASKPINNDNSEIQNLKEQKELYEFAYLEYFLVPNTKAVLDWFYKQSEHGTTHSIYSTQFILPGPVANPANEKEVILKALLDANLISQSAMTFRVTDKGTRLLRFLKYIP